MATTIGTVNQSVVDAKVVSALRSVLPLFNAISWRPTTEGKIKNDSVYVPIATDPTAQSKTAGTLVTSNGTIAGTQVQLSNHYAAGWDCTEGTISRDLFPQFWADKVSGAVYSLAKQVVDATLALLTASNYGDVENTDKLTVAIADFGMSDLAALWKIGVGKAAMLAAVGPPEALSASGEGSVMESRIITDPDSGLSVLYKSGAEPGGKVYGECSILYGVAKGQNAAVRHETA